MIGKATTPASYATSAMLTIFGLNVNEWLALTGIILGIGTFIVNWYYKREHLKLYSRKMKQDGALHTEQD